MTLRRLGIVLALSFVVLQLGCGGGLAGLTGGDPSKKALTDAKALASSLQESYAAFNTMHKDLQGKTAKVGAVPEGVDTSSFEMDKLKGALKAIYSAPVDKGKASKKAALTLYPGTAKDKAAEAKDAALAAPTDAEKELEEYLKGVSPEARTFANGQVTLVKDLRDGFMGVLPASVEALTKQAAEGKVQMEKHLKVAEGAAKLPTATKQTKANVTAIKAEKKKYDELADQILGDLKGMPAQFGESSKTVGTNIGGMGSAAASEVK